MFQRWSRFVARRPKTMLTVSALVLVLSALCLSYPANLSHESEPDDAESTRAMELIEQQVPGAHGHGFTLLFSHPTWIAHEEPFVTELLLAIADLRDDPRVRAVHTPYGTDRADEAGAVADAHRQHDHTMISENLALVFVELEGGPRGVHEQMEAYGELRAMVMSETLTVQATDGAAVTDAFATTLAKDLRLELFGLPVVLVLLVVVFGSLVAAILPLGVGILAVASGLAGTTIFARYVDVSLYAPNIVTLVGLGVAIDYSLFIVSRYREERAPGKPLGVVLAATLETAGRAVLFSGLTVAIGLLGLTFYSGLYFASMGMAGAIVVAFAVLYALTFLPALLVVLGPRVDRLRLPRLGPKRAARPFWGALARAIMRRPVPILVVTVAMAAIAAAPFASIQLAGSGVEALPESHEARQTAETIAAAFPDRGSNEMLLVARFPGAPLTPERVGALYDASRAIADIDGVTAVESIVDVRRNVTREEYVDMYSGDRAALAPAFAEAVNASVGDTIAILLVRAEPAANSEAARVILEEIRALGTVADGELLVAGETAVNADVAQLMRERTPWAVGFVLVATFVLVMLQTGSVVLPLKAVAMNVLSIGASFGALVWIFQEGHLSGVLGFTPAPIDPSVPVLLFCIVFGLSMDYEVLMLSRMHEEYQRTRDNTQAVANGLEKSGRLITSAALIMIVVFAAFIASQVTIMKAIGLGLALAIAIDATIVRALIVPAAMRLMGDANWYGPKSLRALASSFGERRDPLPSNGESELRRG